MHMMSSYVRCLSIFHPLMSRLDIDDLVPTVLEAGKSAGTLAGALQPICPATGIGDEGSAMYGQRE